MSVLLVSGGLDSFVASKLHDYDQLVFVNYGQPYFDKELDAVVRLYGTKVRMVTVSGLPNLGPEIHIDGRNLFLATIALRFSNDIFFAAVDDEKCSDKNRLAFRKMSEILTTHSKGKKVTVDSRLWGMTKAQAVARYLEQGNDSHLLLNTVSCYGPGSGSCWNCQSCFRRWLALEVNGINTGHKFSDEFLEEQTSIRDKRRQRLRITGEL